jgi:hypothetical protein
MNSRTSAPLTAQPASTLPEQAHTPAPSARRSFWQDFSLEERAQMKRNTLFFSIDAILEYLHDCPDESPYPKTLKTLLMTAYLDFQEALEGLEEKGGAV